MIFRRIFQAGAQSGVIMCLGDVACQSTCNILDSKYLSTIDYRRTLQMGLVGLTLHGPYMYLAFSKVDAFFGSSASLLNVVRKSLLIQVTAFPFYVMLLFGYLGFLEGRVFPTGIWDNIKEKVPKAYLSGCFFWPFANALGFRFVPSENRVIYLASVGIVWNAYISYINSLVKVV